MDGLKIAEELRKLADRTENLGRMTPPGLEEHLTTVCIDHGKPKGVPSVRWLTDELEALRLLRNRVGIGEVMLADIEKTLRVTGHFETGSTLDRLVDSAIDRERDRHEKTKDKLAEKELVVKQLLAERDKLRIALNVRRPAGAEWSDWINGEVETVEWNNRERENFFAIINSIVAVLNARGHVYNTLSVADAVAKALDTEKNLRITDEIDMSARVKAAREERDRASALASKLGDRLSHLHNYAEVHVEKARGTDAVSAVTIAIKYLLDMVKELSTSLAKSEQAVANKVAASTLARKAINAHGFRGDGQPLHEAITQAFSIFENRINIAKAGIPASADRHATERGGIVVRQTVDTSPEPKADPYAADPFSEELQLLKQLRNANGIVTTNPNTIRMARSMSDKGLATVLTYRAAYKVSATETGLALISNDK